MDKVTITGTLGERDHVILEFLILKEAKAECSHTRTVDFSKAHFNKLRTINSLGQVAQEEKRSPRGVRVFKKGNFKGTVTNNSNKEKR